MASFPEMAKPCPEGARTGSAAPDGAAGDSAARSVWMASMVDRFGAALTDAAILGLERRRPSLCARRIVTSAQAVWLAIAAATMLALFSAAPMQSFDGAVNFLSALFLVAVMMRALLALSGGYSAPARNRTIADRQLPLYTILVPLYREADMLPGLVAALDALDYPKDRLDAILVAEADDLETLAACRKFERGFIATLAVPPSHPRTKPKALDFALTFARGEHLVVFDAEDRPEPDQLRKAVAAFRDAPRDVACLQARLAFYNSSACWLAAQAEADYRLWFGRLLPGLARLGVPIPLGGTSNHFRSDVLREVGAWDPFNVTEDADLGMRLARSGFRVSMLDSTTFEETPATLSSWMKQRSRWLKGYMQTWLVHSRDSGALIARTGLGGFLAFHFFIGGAVVSAFANPVLWLTALLTCVFPHGFGAARDAAPIALGGALGGNALLSLMIFATAPRRNAHVSLSVPVYWLLISAAAYRAFVQLLLRPFHWEKTMHGAEASHA